MKNTESSNGYGIGADGVTPSTEERECAQCHRLGYLTYMPGEGQTDSRHSVLVTPGLRDGSCLDQNFCEECADKYDDQEAEYIAEYEMVLYSDGIGWDNDGYGDPIKGTREECIETLNGLRQEVPEYREARLGVRNLATREVEEIANA